MSTRTTARLLGAACVLVVMPLIALMIVNVFTLVFDCTQQTTGPAFCQNWHYGTQVRVWLIDIGFAFVFMLPFTILAAIALFVVFVMKMFRSDAAR